MTWKNAPDGRVLKSDTSVAKNYLDEKQIRKLERSVSVFLIMNFWNGWLSRKNPGARPGWGKAYCLVNVMFPERRLVL